MVMGKFDIVLQGPSPDDVARASAVAAQQSLQSSLYQRLKRSRGAAAGQIGWMLLRLAQYEHRDHDEAADTFCALSKTDQRALLAIARDAARAMKTSESRELADAVITVMSHHIEKIGVET